MLIVSLTCKVPLAEAADWTLSKKHEFPPGPAHPHTL